MQKLKNIKPKLLMPVCTRVPVEVRQLVDDLAGLKGCDRAKWVREAIQEKIQSELGQSSTVAVQNSKNTTSTSEYFAVFKNLFSFFQANKKPDIAGRAFCVH